MKDCLQRPRATFSMLFGLAATFLIFATASAFTQVPSTSPQKTPSSANTASTEGVRAQEAFIIEQSINAETYQADGTGTYENSGRVLVQSEAGIQQFGLLSFPYQKDFETIAINYVRVLKPNGNAISTPPENVQDIEAEITREAPVYSDLREKQIAVKSVAVGDRIEWQYTTHIFKALAPNEFWTEFSFPRKVAVLDDEFRLNVPKDKYVNVKSTKIQPKIREEGDRRIYEWKLSQPKAEEEDLKVKYGPPFKQPQPDIQVSTFRSWDEVGNWYYALQRDRVVPTAEVKAKALELTKDAKNDDDKMHALYNFVATQFRYIGIAFGIGRYQPHAAAAVLDNSYGDCKDKHTLLASLLQAVGIEASPAIISSIHAVDPDVPSPAQFDHVITAVHRGSDVIWLDATSEVAPFGVLTVNLRDKKALMISANGSALVTTPAKAGIDQFETFHSDATLSDSGELKASMDEDDRGDNEILLRSAFHEVPQGKWKDLMQAVSYQRGFLGTVSDVTASSPEKTANPFHVAYDYDRTDYSRWSVDKSVTVPLPAAGLPQLDDEHEKSGEPVRLGAPRKMDFISMMKLPAGYDVEIPKDLDIKSDFAEYRAKYSLKDNTLHTEREMIVLSKEVPASKYDAYRQFLHKVNDDEGAWVSFTKTSAATVAEATSAPENTAASDARNTSWPPPPETDAGHEFNDGILLLQQRDYRGALQKLEEAAERDPKLPGVWCSISTAHRALHQVDQSLDDARRQTEETPNLAAAFEYLGWSLLRAHRNEEALAALQRWRELKPEDPKATLQYGGTLILLKRYPEAINVFQKALQDDPKQYGFEYQLGNAYLNTGNSEAAVAHFSRAADLSTNKPLVLNDAAYQLAQKQVQLNHALSWAQQAVAAIEEQASQLTMDQLQTKSFALMNQVYAYWDTLGDAYFEEGDYPRAERYLRAAWWLRESAVVGEHLAQVYDKLNQPQKAEQFRLLASATPDHGSTAVNLPQLRHDAEFSPARAELKDWDPYEMLGKMRTVHLPQVSAKSGSAEFLLLFGNTSTKPSAVKATENPVDRSVHAMTVESVKFVSGDEDMKAGEEALRKAAFDFEAPDSHPIKLIRRGILVCGALSHSCDFTLFTADSVRSAN